jgi:hypothetical protein
MVLYGKTKSVRRREVMVSVNATLVKIEMALPRLR